MLRGLQKSLGLACRRCRSARRICLRKSLSPAVRRAAGPSEKSAPDAGRFLRPPLARRTARQTIRPITSKTYNMGLSSMNSVKAGRLLLFPLRACLLKRDRAACFHIGKPFDKGLARCFIILARRLQCAQHKGICQSILFLTKTPCLFVEKCLGLQTDVDNYFSWFLLRVYPALYPLSTKEPPCLSTANLPCAPRLHSP